MNFNKLRIRRIRDARGFVLASSGQRVFPIKELAFYIFSMPQSESILDALLFGQNVEAKAVRNEGARYFGEATGINWCERDYQVTPYMAEFWNTTTNVLYIYVGLKALGEARRLELPSRFYWFALFIFLTGVCSAFFHATLWLLGQRLDEIFENAALIAMYHSVANGNIQSSDTIIVLHFLMSAAGIVFITAFLFCEVHLIGMAILSGRQIYLQTKENEELEFHFRVRRAILLTAIGGVCWLADRLCCDQLQAINIPIFGHPQLHASWHVFTGIALWEMFCITAALHLCRDAATNQKNGPALLPLTQPGAFVSWYSMSALGAIARVKHA